MAGNLYQLKTQSLPGMAVLIDGPYDRYGKVLSVRDDGYRLIRGTGDAKPIGRTQIHIAETTQ